MNTPPARHGCSRYVRAPALASTVAVVCRLAAGDRVDGPAVTLARPDAMKAAVARAEAAGLPVVGLNAGTHAWQSRALLDCFGHDESVCGRALGEKLDDLKAARTWTR